MIPQNIEGENKISLYFIISLLLWTLTVIEKIIFVKLEEKK